MDELYGHGQRHDPAVLAAAEAVREKRRRRAQRLAGHPQQVLVDAPDELVRRDELLPVGLGEGPEVALDRRVDFLQFSACQLGQSDTSFNLVSIPSLMLIPNLPASSSVTQTAPTHSGLSRSINSWPFSSPSRKNDRAAACAVSASFAMTVTLAMPLGSVGRPVRGSGSRS